MSFTFGGVLGTATSNTSSSSISITTSGTVPVGGLIAVAVACDNSGANLPSVTLDILRPESLIVGTGYSTSTATAGVEAGNFTFIMRVLAPLPSGTVITATLSAAVTAKAMGAVYWTCSVPFTLKGGLRTTAGGTGTTMSQAFTSGNVPGDFSIVTAGYEYSSATPDAAWNTRVHINGGGATDTGVGLIIADKNTTDGVGITYTGSLPASTGKLMCGFSFSLLGANAETPTIVEIKDSLLLIGGSGTGGGGGGGGPTVPTEGQLWPRGNW